MVHPVPANAKHRPIIGRLLPCQALIVFSAAALSLAGCAGKDTIYRDIGASRARAYERWQDDRNQKQTSENVYRGALSREQCVDIALERNKQIMAVVWEKEKATGRITEAYSQALPNVGLEGRYTRLDQAGASMVPGGGLNTYGLTAGVTQPLFRGGAIGAGITAAKIYSYMADERKQEVVQGVIFDVCKSYYDVLLAQELLRVSEQAVSLSQSHRDDVIKRKDQGIASDYDVLRASVEVTNYEAEMIQNRNRLHLAKSSFYKLLGLSQESEIEFTDTFQYEAAAANLDEAVSEAYTRRPELIQAELALKLSEQALKAAKAERWPKVDAFFNETYSNPDPHFSPGWGDGWTAGAAMRFPIFDGFRTKGLVRQAKADVEKSRVQLSDAEETVLLNVKQAVLSVEDARAFVESQKANAQTAQEGLKLVEAGYREGVNTELEVRDARQALLRATSLHYQAIHQHQVAVLSLKKATGAMLPQKPEPAETAR